MKPQSITTGLLIAFATAVVADVAVHRLKRPTAAAEYPQLASFNPENATRITIGRTDDSVVLERRDDGWWLVAPTTGRANQEAVDQVLSVVSAGVLPEAGVGTDDLAPYGLAGGTELRVDVGSEQQALATLYIGSDAGSGSTWVRFGGTQAVYRARVGGRATFDRGVRAWRDLEVTRLDPGALTEVGLTLPEESLKLVPKDGGWSHAWRRLDGPTLGKVVGELAALRALEVAAPGYIEGPLAAELVTANQTVTLRFEPVGDLWFVGRDDRDERWRISPELPRLLMAAPPSLEDRHVWGPIEAEVVGIERRTGRDRAVLQRTEGRWSRTLPTPLSVEEKRANAAGMWLRGPRVAQWAPKSRARDLGFPGTESWRVRFGNGRTRTLELGAPSRINGVDCIAVRDRSRGSKIGWVDARIVAGVQSLFLD